MHKQGFFRWRKPTYKRSRPYIGRVTHSTLMMWWFCTAGSCRRSRLQARRRELERTTDIFFEDTVMEADNDWQGNESCLTEGDNFVGTTAKFSVNWDIVPLRPDLRVMGYIPLPLRLMMIEWIRTSPVARTAWFMPEEAPLSSSSKDTE